jgi:AcrR family transcriptional regulator
MILTSSISRCGVAKARRIVAGRASYHHGDLKAALIAAATGMLEAEGPEAISFRAIARAAGVSQTAPYNHFQSKEHLLATVALAGFEALTAAQAAAQPSGGPAERIRALAGAYVRFARGRPQLYRLMFGVGITDWRAYPELEAAAKACYQPVQQALADHFNAAGIAAPGVLETASIAAWSLVHGLASLLIDGRVDPAETPAGDADTLADRIAAWFVAGMLE